MRNGGLVLLNSSIGGKKIKNKKKLSTKLDDYLGSFYFLKEETQKIRNNEEFDIISNINSMVSIIILRANK